MFGNILNSGSGFAGIVLVPDKPSRGERDTAGDGKQDCIDGDIINRQITGNAGDAVSRGAEAGNRAEDRADRAADHAADKGLEKAHIDAENGGFRDTERRRSG